MKRITALFLLLVLCISLTACGQGNNETPTEAPANASDALNAIPDELQGVWGPKAAGGNALTLYGFKGNNVETFIVNCGVAAAKALSGTYTVEDGKISYDFGGGTGYSTFTYDNTLAIFDATGGELKKLSSAELMDYLAQEEKSADNSGVICLANIMLNYYSSSTEAGAARQKKETANTAIKTAGEAALKNLNTNYDKVQKLTWYQHKNQPQYTDITCYIYPYIGRTDDGETWLRVQLDYTDAKTNAGWIFFNRVVFSVDGKNTKKSFNRSEITRDNDTEVWEIADFAPDGSEIQLLKSIANSHETIIRFEGDEYYEDHVVTDKEKTAILDVLAAYEYMANCSA